MEEAAADRLARSGLEEDVVGHYHRRGAAYFEQADHVLHEVELLVAGGGPEVLTLVAVR